MTSGSLVARLLTRSGRPLARQGAALSAPSAPSAPPISTSAAHCRCSSSSASGGHVTSWPDFVPRAVYEPSSSLPRSYFLGHHRAALDHMRRVLATVGLVIECRDMRVPLTAWNPLLETSLSSGVASEEPESTAGVAGLSSPPPFSSSSSSSSSSSFLLSAYTHRSRIIIYTKRDLVVDSSSSTSPLPADLRRLAAFHRHEADAVLFMGTMGPDETRGTRETRETRETARETARLLGAVRAAARRHGQQSLTDLRALVVGMPNAGKSTLLNRLRAAGMADPQRRGRAAKTGSEPGVTRKLGTPVRVLGGSGDDDAQENLLLMDTPGVFVPYVPDAESMLKLALVGCVREGLVPPVTLADYLLFQLNTRDPGRYVAAFGLDAPTNDINALLDAVAHRTGKLARGGAPVHEAAALHLVHAWRRGRLGRFCLDDLSPASFTAARAAAQRAPPVSLSQARKREKERRKARAAARHSGVVVDDT